MFFGGGGVVFWRVFGMGGVLVGGVEKGESGRWIDRTDACGAPALWKHREPSPENHPTKPEKAHRRVLVPARLAHEKVCHLLAHDHGLRGVGDVEEGGPLFWGRH